MLAEHAPRLVVLYAGRDQERRTTLDALLPEGFGPDDLTAARGKAVR
jgi:hypothetical protein